MGRRIDLEGKTFGTIKVIDWDKASSRWNCQCVVCGELYKKKINRITAETNLSGCFNCYHESRFLPYVGEVPGWYLGRLQAKSKVRKIEVSASYQDIAELYIRNNKVCALSGLPIRFANQGQQHFFTTASLDRINSDLGYITGNCQWVHKDVNTMKLDLPNQEFIDLCDRIHVYAGMKHEPIDGSVLVELSSAKLGHNRGPGSRRWKGVGMIRHTRWDHVLKQAKDRNINVEPDVNIEWAWQKYEEQGGLCYYSALPIHFSELAKARGTASLERIDSDEPYSQENLVWCHKKINRMKMSMTYNRFLHYCESISLHSGRTK